VHVLPDFGRVHLQFSDGDITINLLSAGYMHAKGWKGKTKYNPAGVKSIMREYKHVAPANFLEGRGTQSGNHVDIMGNYAMIEDILRIAAGQTAEQLGGDRFYSKLLEWVERVKIDVGLKEHSSFAQKLGLSRS
jgi:phospholipid:diacylglycerol acyltransferase